VKLRVFPDLRQHNFRELLDRGLLVTINSDDPSYFGGYVADNYIGTADALSLTAEQMIKVARNSSSPFLPAAEQQQHLDAMDALRRLTGSRRRRARRGWDVYEAAQASLSAVTAVVFRLRAPSPIKEGAHARRRRHVD
jgi:adenosine deaminase